MRHKKVVTDETERKLIFVLELETDSLELKFKRPAAALLFALLPTMRDIL